MKEEDIKILEKLLKEYKESGRMLYFVNLDDIQAIEHLIERNKELEENYINPSKARFTYFDNGKGTKVVIEGFIPKSKVREKIELLEKISDNGINAVRFAGTYEDEIKRTERQKNISTIISILQELLEEES